MRICSSAKDIGPIAHPVADARLYLTAYMSNGATALQIVSPTRGLLGTISRNIAGFSDRLNHAEFVINHESPFVSAAKETGLFVESPHSTADQPIWLVCDQERQAA